MKKIFASVIFLCVLVGTLSGAFAQWPMDGYDAGRSAYYSGVFSTEKSILWQVGFSDPVTDMIVGENSVLVRISKSAGPEVVALNPENGAVKWRADVPKGYERANLVYSEGMLLAAHEEGVVCFNTNGEKMWEINDDCDEGIILRGNDLLLVDHYAIEMYGLSQREKLWEKDYATMIFRNDFVIGEDAVFMREATLIAYDASTGEVLYERKDIPFGNAMLVYSNDRLYAGTSDGNLYCIDAATGNPLWVFQTDGNKTGQFLSEALTPAVGGGNIVFAAFDDKLYCVDESGNLKWKTPNVDLSFDNQPAITDNLIFVIDTYNKLRCFDIHSGKEIWTLRKVKNELASHPIGNPILSGGKIFGRTSWGGVSNPNYYTFCIATGLPSPSPAATPSPSPSPLASPPTSPSPSPAATPSPSPSPLASPPASPSPTPSGQGLSLPIEVISAAVAAIIIVIVAVAAVILKRRQSRISKAPPPPPPPSSPF